MDGGIPGGEVNLGRLPRITKCLIFHQTATGLLAPLIATGKTVTVSVPQRFFSPKKITNGKVTWLLSSTRGRRGVMSGFAYFRDQRVPRVPESFRDQRVPQFLDHWLGFRLTAISASTSSDLQGPAPHLNLLKNPKLQTYPPTWPNREGSKKSIPRTFLQSQIIMIASLSWILVIFPSAHLNSV